MIKDFLQFIKGKMFTTPQTKDMDSFERLSLFIEDSLSFISIQKIFDKPKTRFFEETSFLFSEEKISFNLQKRIEKISKKFKLNYFEQKQIINLFDSIKDKRLYAALLEETNPINEIYDIDWKNTSKQSLSLIFKSKAALTSVLDKTQQQKFAQYCEDLIFFQKKLPLGIEAVLINEKNQCALFDVLGVEHLDNENLRFIQNMLLKNQVPQSFQEKRMALALLEIKNICSHLDLQSFWKSGLSINFSKKLSHLESLEHLQKQTMFLPKIQKINFVSAKDLYLSILQKRKQERHRYKKSSILFWGPLLVLFYFLLYYH